MSPDCAVAQMAQAGKYLSFRLGTEEFGLEILKVQEIVGATGITPWHSGPECLRGLIRLRGRTLSFPDRNRRRTASSSPRSPMAGLPPPSVCWWTRSAKW